MALILALTGMTLLLTLGGALVTLTGTEMAIAAGVRSGAEVFYAAESGIAMAMRRLETVPDWEMVVSEAAMPFISLPFREVVQGAAVDPRLSVVVQVTDDPVKDPSMLVLRSEASGAMGAARAIETTIWRSPDGVRALDWREVR